MARQRSAHRRRSIGCCRERQTRTPVRNAPVSARLATCPRISSSCAARANTTSRTSTVAFPRDRLVVITGLSGSGKSSLAFDTIYAEGQRRYVESLSAYARQFLGQMEKPDVDQIDGLSPAISIDQKGASRNPRSTVGTVTEIYDHLRLLFARIGIPHCPNGHAIERQSVQQIVDQVLALPEGTRLLVLGPLIKDRKTEGDRVFDAARRQGFVRVRVDGEMFDIAEAPKLDKYKRHSIEVVVDRYIVRHAEAPEGADASAGRPADRSRRPARSSRTRTRAGWPIRSRRRSGSARASCSSPRRRATTSRPTFEERRYSEKYSCPYDGFTVDELEPRSFSFNSPHGACPACTGLGTKLEIDPALRHPGPLEEPRRRAPSCPWARMPTDASWRLKILEAICAAHGWDLPGADPGPARRRRSTTSCTRRRTRRVIVRYRHERGENTYKATFEGVVTNLERRYRETDSDYIKTELEKFMVTRPCPDVRRQAAPPGDPGGDDRRPQRLGRLDDVDHGRPALGDRSGADADRARADDRRTSSSRRSSPGSASSSTSGSTT